MRVVLLLLGELRRIEASFALMLPADQAAIDRFVCEHLAVRLPEASKRARPRLRVERRRTPGSAR